MPRRGQISKRDVLPDPLYNSKLVTKLINNIMYDGKKGVAQKIVYDAFSIVEEKLGKSPLDAFVEALGNIMPSLEVKAKRVGGSTYQVPLEVRPSVVRHSVCVGSLSTRDSAAREPWLRNLPERLWMLSITPAEQSRRRTRHTVWLKPTRLLHITDIDFEAQGYAA